MCSVLLTKKERTNVRAGYISRRNFSPYYFAISHTQYFFSLLSLLTFYISHMNVIVHTKCIIERKKIEKKISSIFSNYKICTWSRTQACMYIEQAISSTHTLTWRALRSSSIEFIVIIIDSLLIFILFFLRRAFCVSWSSARLLLACFFCYGLLSCMLCETEA